MHHNFSYYQIVMSTIDLIVLSILNIGPKSAYDLVRYVRDKQVDKVLKISEPAIFKCCRRLANNGYLKGIRIQGNSSPSKVIYEINESGQSRLLELMHYYANNYQSFYIEFNAFIWNLDNLQADKARELLYALQKQLHVASIMVTEHEKEVVSHLPFGPRQIVKQYRMVINTLAQWIDELIEDFNK